MMATALVAQWRFTDATRARLGRRVRRTSSAFSIDAVRHPALAGPAADALRDGQGRARGVPVHRRDQVLRARTSTTSSTTSRPSGSRTTTRSSTPTTAPTASSRPPSCATTHRMPAPRGRPRRTSRRPPVSTIYRGHIFHVSGSPSVVDAREHLVSLPDGALVVSDAGTIEWIGAAAELPSTFADASVVDNRGGYIVPGLRRCARALSADVLHRLLRRRPAARVARQVHLPGRVAARRPRVRRAHRARFHASPRRRRHDGRDGFRLRVSARAGCPVPKPRGMLGCVWCRAAASRRSGPDSAARAAHRSRPRRSRSCATRFDAGTPSIRATRRRRAPGRDRAPVQPVGHAGDAARARRAVRRGARRRACTSTRT